MEQHAIVAALAAMTDAEVADTLAAARGDAETVDPKEKAVRALRRHRGLDRTKKATPEEAADALRRMRNAD